MAKRREARVAGIVDCAWKLAREHGIAGLSLHALAREVGIRQPSLYGYFDSKDALYDAMFADGNRQLIEHLDALKVPRDPRVALKQWLRAFAGFALEDPARFELLFQRHIPGFTPSAASYALAEEVLGRAHSLMRAAGVTQQGDSRLHRRRHRRHHRSATQQRTRRHPVGAPPQSPRRLAR